MNTPTTPNNELHAQVDKIFSRFENRVAELKEYLRNRELAPINYNVKYNEAEKRAKEPILQLITQAERQAELKGRMKQMFIEADAYNGKGLAPGFQKRMRSLQAELRTLQENQE